MDAPARSEVVARFRQLIEESAPREEVATWAQKWVIADNPPDMEKDVWEALQFLAGADLISTDRPHLYSAQDFERELAKLLKC
jgi:hypothetical protein